MENTLVPVSCNHLATNGKLISHPNPDRQISTTFCLRRKTISREKLEEFNSLLSTVPSKRKYKTREEIEDGFGCSEKDIEAVEAYFSDYDINIEDVNSLTRVITVSATAEAFEKAFHTKLGIYEFEAGVVYIAYKIDLFLPRDLARIILHVDGLVLPYKKESRPPIRIDKGDLETNYKQVGYSMNQIATAYNFPEDLSGCDQCIGVVELGGSYNPSDLKKFFEGSRDTDVVTVGEFNDKDSILNNAEVTLDLEVIGALAPDARLVVYYGHTLMDAMRSVICDKENDPQVISISWAGSEHHYNEHEKDVLDLLFYQAALLGITVVAASGDNGAMNGLNTPNVSLPSSNPYVLGCGGTILKLDEDERKSEVVWNEFNGSLGSGGGFSSLYPLPDFQVEANWAYPFYKVPMRGVPDVAANASMRFGYASIYNGQEEIIGGTSASTPVWASLIALMNEELGDKLGYFTPFLYGLAGSDAFIQITSGDNQVYPASLFWNPCTGLGAPNGAKLLEQLKVLFEEREKQ